MALLTISWEQAMSVISLSKTATPTYRLLCWSQLEALFGEWWHRIVSRYELESLSERDLADMGRLVSMRSTRYRSHSGRSNIGLMRGFEAENWSRGRPRTFSANTAK